MTNTDSPLDGILGSVIQEAIEYQAANDGEDTLTHARYLEESRKEAIAAINAYTTNKIIEARIDELQELQMADNIPDTNKDQIYLWYLKNRIAELQAQAKKDK